MHMRMETSTGKDETKILSCMNGGRIGHLAKFKLEQSDARLPLNLD